MFPESPSRYANAEFSSAECPRADEPRLNAPSAPPKTKHPKNLLSKQKSVLYRSVPEQLLSFVLQVRSMEQAKQPPLPSLIPQISWASGAAPLSKSL